MDTRRAKKPAVRSSGLERLIMLSAFAALAALQVRALNHVPLAAFGEAGAEYIPHIQRQYAGLRLQAEGFSFFFQPFATLRALDGHYPALLHMIAAPLEPLICQGNLECGFVAASYLNLVFLAMLGLAVAVLAGARARMAAFLLTLSLPGVFAAARRYYYDLPMTACVLGAAACLMQCGSRRLAVRIVLASLLSGAALLVKWSAALYLAPIWLVAAYQMVRLLGWRNACAWCGLAAGIVIAMVAPVAALDGGSFDHLLRLGTSLEEGRGTTLEAVLFYATALYGAGAGPILTPLLMLSIGLGCALSATRRSLGRAGWCIAVPLLYLVLFLPRLDGRYLLPILPWLAVAAGQGLAGLPDLHRAKALATGACLLGVAQVIWIDFPIAGAAGPSSGAGVDVNTPWRAWWWSSAREDVRSPIRDYEALVADTLAQVGPDARLAVVSRKGPWAPTHPWMFFLDRLAPGHPALLPAKAVSVDTLRTRNIFSRVDALVVVGGAGAEDAVEAALGRGNLEHRRLTRGGLEADLYYR